VAKNGDSQVAIDNRTWHLVSLLTSTTPALWHLDGLLWIVCSLPNKMWYNFNNGTDLKAFSFT
jgi:hypothetical protein